MTPFLRYSSTPLLITPLRLAALKDFAQADALEWLGDERPRKAAEQGIKSLHAGK